MIAEQFLLGHPVFDTYEFATATGMRRDVASRYLSRKAKEGLLQAITRGVWGNRHHYNFSIFGAVPYLLGHEHGYVSFISALSRHGVISQIPQVLTIATTGHSRSLQSPLGAFEFLKLKADYMIGGVDWHSQGLSPYSMASPEKALLDCLYISTRRGKRFSYFSEVDFTLIRKRTFHQLLRLHAYPAPIEHAMKERFDHLLATYPVGTV